MNHRYHPGASQDLFSAISYYDAQRTGLGYEFLQEVTGALQRIKEAPERWPEVEFGLRRYRLSRFPFEICYRVHHERLIILAVAHSSRRPNYWRDRAS
jgi:hypothetical protein